MKICCFAKDKMRLRISTSSLVQHINSNALFCENKESRIECDSSFISAFVSDSDSTSQQTNFTFGIGITTKND